MKGSKMKKMKKRILAALLCTTMMLNTGVSAMADGGTAVSSESAHVHTEECYEKSKTDNLICTKAEAAEGHVHGDTCYEVTSTPELICTQAETAGHTHGDSCMETTKNLICGKEEHTHGGDCYKTETRDVCSDESEEHTCGDGCVETEEVLTCTAEEHTHDDGCYESETNIVCGQNEVEAHTHGEGCYTTAENKVLKCTLEEVEAHTHNDDCYAWEEKLVCTLPETAPAAEQPEKEEKAEEAEEAAEVNLQNDDETGIKVSVKSTSDVIPEDTKVVVAPMEMDEEHETALAEAVGEFEVLGYTAYDISLKDAEDEDITLGENKVEVAIDFEELIPEGINAEEVKDVVLVHITTDEEEKLTAETVGTVEITEEKATVEFEADSFSPYVVTYLSEAEEAVEEVAVEEPVVEDVVLTYTSEDEAYTVTVTGAPEVLENVTAFEAVPVTDEGKITALTKQLTAKAAEMQKTSLGFENYEFKFMDAEGNEVSVNGEVKVSLSFAEERIPEAATAENVDAVDAALLKTGTDDKGEAVLEEINGLVSAEAGAVKELVYTTEAPKELILAWSGDVYRALPNYEDDEVVITLEGTEYALQNVVGFNVTPIKEDNEETKEQYAEVAQQLEEKIAEENEAKEVVGFLAYDITLVDADGNELEPQGGVRVSMEYKEAAAPESVAEVEEAEVTIHHFEEDEKGEVKQIVDMVAEETIEAEVTTTENAEVEKAEFVTDSFSVYAVTWTYNSEYTVTLEPHYGVVRGNEFEEFQYELKDLKYRLPDMNVSDKNTVELEAYSNAKIFEDDDYAYYKAYVVNGTEYLNPKAATKLKLESGGRTPNLKYDEKQLFALQRGKNVCSIYYVYKELPEPIDDTVDSQEENINIHVHDYSVWDSENRTLGYEENVKYKINEYSNLFFANDGFDYDEAHNRWTNGKGTYPNIVKANLESEFPVLSEGINQNPNVSLSYLFADGYESNFLFKKEDGYFVYDSDANFAKLNTNNGTFNVYSGPNDGFFPFNDYTDDIERGRGNQTKADNHHFGMNIDFTFMQPVNGLIDNNPVKPMEFEFSGDDDVWVFIDDMLVLDLGGIHGETGGKINFNSGYVSYTGEDRNKSQVTILSMYESALQEKYGNNTERINEELNKYFMKDSNGKFISKYKDYSPHKLNFFYLERGADKSNCMIKFNLISIPENTVSVEKEITETNMADFADATFTFRLETNTLNTSTGEYSGRSSCANKPYKLYEVNGNEKTPIPGTFSTDNNGEFELKHGQRAEFEGIPASTYYWVTELGVVSTEYDEVKFNGKTAITNENNEYIGDGNFSTGKLLAQDCVYVKFQNKCNVANKRNLVINKVMADKSVGEKFEVKVQYADGLKADGKINWVDYEGEYHLGSSTEKAETAKDGIIKLVAGGPKAYIVGLISDTKYRVFEELDPNQQLEYAAPVYSGTGSASGTFVEATDTDIAYYTDTIELSGSSEYTVTVTNSLLKKVNVNKVWGDEDYSNKTRPNAIQFKLQYSDGTNSPQDVLEKSASAEVKLIPLNITLSESTSTAETKTVKIAEQEMKINLKYTSWGVEISGLSGNYIYSALEENVVGYKASYSPDDNGNIKIINTLDWYIVKQSASVDETTGAREPLPGAEFELRSAKTNKVYYGTSDNNGVVKWYSVKQNQNEAALISKISDGEYTLKETKAPSNYMLSETKYKVVVDNGFPTVTVDLNPYKNVELIQTKGNDNKVTKQQVNIYVYNTCLYELPSTGGHGIYTTMLSGFALMLGAAYVWFTSRRKESSNN